MYGQKTENGELCITKQTHFKKELKKNLSPLKKISSGINVRIKMYMYTYTYTYT